MVCMDVIWVCGEDRNGRTDKEEITHDKIGRTMYWHLKIDMNTVK